MRLLNYYKYLFAFSGLILILGIISLGVFRLNLGIDFKGGTVTEIEFQQPVDQSKIREVLDADGLHNYQLQLTGEKGVIIRTEALEKAQHDKVAADIKSKVGDFTEKRFDSFGPVVGQELKKKAIYQLILVSLGIVFYIGYAFRKVTRPITPWQFGIAAIIALLHDLLIVLGIFSILGHFYSVEIDSLFVTAMLTVLGFSVHDTIIVFDRIRENLKVYAGQSTEFIVNHSISQTLVRSLNTSLTVLFVLLAMLLFGGATIKFFVLALLIGIAAGTYSSIFVASPIIVLLQNWRNRKR
ncbi:MAG TPA: protein translocase subunit SecF [Patescibacteria group bacterium]|jgi:preprotein translocase subunit SecF|nr:protein translocase subunit SecF [Patescibacteria group bacterium]